MEDIWSITVYITDVITWPQGQMKIPSNYFDGHVTVDAVGVIASLYALNAMIHVCYEHGLSELQARLTKQYYLLRDSASEHAESGLIFGASD